MAKTKQTPDTEVSVMPAARTDAFPVEMILQNAIDKGLPVETMKELLAMRSALKKEAAKEAFDDDMAKLQGAVPVIRKTKVVLDKVGKERYRYAPIDSIVDQVKAYISRYGFSYSITTIQEGNTKELVAICTVKHRLGHAEESTFRVPVDTESYMTAPQKVGAALTFAKRYAFCNAFGIMTGDGDTDAQGNEEEEKPHAQPILPKPTGGPVPALRVPLAEKNRPELMKELHALLAKYGMPREEFKKKYGVTTMEGIAEDVIRKAIVVLRERTKRGELWRDESVPMVEADMTEVSADDIVDSLPPDLGGKRPSPREQMEAGMKSVQEKT
jgi:hypothetical protein